MNACSVTFAGVCAITAMDEARCMSLLRKVVLVQNNCGQEEIGPLGQAEMQVIFAVIQPYLAMTCL